MGVANKYSIGTMTLLVQQSRESLPLVVVITKIVRFVGYFIKEN